jgi:DNA polymerase I-like protein with 3'-5' exonuclease and polymerase domains
MTLRLRRHFEPQLEAAGLAELFRTMEVPLVGVLADMEAAGIAIDVAHFASLRERFKASASGWSARSTRRRASSSTSTRTCSSGRCCSRSCSCR